MSSVVSLTRRKVRSGRTVRKPCRRRGRRRRGPETAVASSPHRRSPATKAGDMPAASGPPGAASDRFRTTLVHRWSAHPGNSFGLRSTALHTPYDVFRHATFRYISRPATSSATSGGLDCPHGHTYIAAENRHRLVD